MDGVPARLVGVAGVPKRGVRALLGLLCPDGASPSSSSGKSVEISGPLIVRSSCSACRSCLFVRLRFLNFSISSVAKNRVLSALLPYKYEGNRVEGYGTSRSLGSRLPAGNGGVEHVHIIF